MPNFALTLASLQAKAIVEAEISADLLAIAVAAEDPKLAGLASAALEAAIESVPFIDAAVAIQAGVVTDKLVAKAAIAAGAGG